MGPFVHRATARKKPKRGAVIDECEVGGPYAGLGRKRIERDNPSFLFSSFCGTGVGENCKWGVIWQDDKIANTSRVYDCKDSLH